MACVTCMYTKLDARKRIVDAQFSLHATRNLEESTRLLANLPDFNLKAYVDPMNGNNNVSNNCSSITSPCANLGMIFNIFERFPNYVDEGKTAFLTIYLMNDIVAAQTNENCGIIISNNFQKKITKVVISTDSIMVSRRLVCGNEKEFLRSTNVGLPFVLEFFLLDLSNITIFAQNMTEVAPQYSNLNSCSIKADKITFFYSNIFGITTVESSNFIIESSALSSAMLNYISRETSFLIRNSYFYDSAINLDPQTLASSRTLTISSCEFYYAKRPNLKNFPNYFINDLRYPYEKVVIMNSIFIGSGIDLDNLGAFTFPHIYPFSLDVDGSTFKNLYSKDGGASFYIAGYTTIIMSRSVFDSNRVLKMGGAIRMKGLGTRATFLQCTFQNNEQVLQNYVDSTSFNTLFGGGAIYSSMDSPSSLVFHTCIFRNNSAGGLGGAILTYSGRSDEYLFVGSEIYGNTAGFYGGGVAMLVNPSLSLYDEYVSLFDAKKTKIIGNQAAIGGGLFFNSLNTIQLDLDSVILNNTASKYSPALFYNNVKSFVNNALVGNNYIRDGSIIVPSQIDQYPTRISLFQQDRITALSTLVQIVPGYSQVFYAQFKDSNGNIANTSLIFNMQSYWKLSLLATEGSIILDDLNFYPSDDFIMVECKTSLLRREVKGDTFTLKMAMTSESSIDAFTDIQVATSFNVSVGPCGAAEYIEARQATDGFDYYICSNRPSIIVGVTISVVFISCIICILLIIFTVKFCLLYRDQRRKAKKEKELEMKLMDFELNYTKLGNTNSSINSQSGSGIDYWMIKEEDIEIQQKIAEGGQGSIFKGKWKNKTQVAIKTFKVTLEEEAEASFQQEVALLRAVHHENIVTFYGVVVLDTTRCMVTEFVPNGSLEYWITKLKKGEKKISFKEKLKILLDIAAAMSYLHELNPPIIHRDLKPGNVLLDNQMKAKICDLGVSKIVADNMVEKTNQIGTFNFMAIETFNGTEYNEKCDVFSFSILAWQLLFEENAVYSNELLKNKRVSYFMTDTDRQVYEKLTPQNFNNYYVAKLISEGLRYPLPSLSKTLEDEKKLFIWVEEYMNEEGIDTSKLTVRILPIYFSLIESCWRAEFNQRPSFTFIVKKIQEMIEMV